MVFATLRSLIGTGHLHTSFNRSILLPEPPPLSCFHLPWSPRAGRQHRGPGLCFALLIAESAVQANECTDRSSFRNAACRPPPQFANNSLSSVPLAQTQWS